MLHARCRMLALQSAITVAIVLGGSAAAFAGPVWRLESLSNSSVAPGGQLTYQLQMVNGGDTAMDGSLYTLTATLPPRVTGVAVTPDISGNLSTLDCPSVAGQSVIVCTGTDMLAAHLGGGVRLTVDVAPDAAPEVATRFDITGGGGSDASTVDPSRVDAAPLRFGLDAFDGQITSSDGSPFSQAGGHPDAATVWIDFNTMDDLVHGSGLGWPVEATKDVFVELPAGLVGDPTGMDQCTAAQIANNVGAGFAACPPASQIGTTIVRTNVSGLGAAFGPLPVFNMVPPPNVPARFGFRVTGSVVTLDAEVRSGSDYGISINAQNIPEGLAVSGTSVTLWGVPADPSHDAEHACPNRPAPSQAGPSCPVGGDAKAFVRNPTSCPLPGVGLPTTAHIDSWQHPGVFDTATFVSHDSPAYPLPPSDWGAQHGPDGCERVPFDPHLTATPGSPPQAGAPSGFQFDVTLPQSSDATLIGQSDLKKAVVTLPEGVRVSPSSADGLAGCSSARIALRSSAEPSCPEASKLGAVTIDTPLLDEQVTGGIYLATPFDNPFHSLVAIYLVAKARGVVLKIPGQAAMDPVTGQITTTFDDNPQLPFSRLHLEFKSGPRAPLVTPKKCGTYTTHAELTGWNGRVVSADSSFTLTENARGKPCPTTFTPGFSAGTASNSAGSSSSFLLRLTRDDEDEDLKGVTVDLPKGLTARFADVPLCGDADANAGTCPDASKVGSVTVGAGAGSSPFFITNGRAYLTGPYKGAPFGLSIVVPAVAGPFNLGTVTVRQAIYVDKHEATGRVVSDPLPTILEGIPLDVRDVRVNIDRPGFFLNPTSCAEKTISGVITSTEGATVNVSDRFQASDCASLALKPKMTLTVGGRGHTNRGGSTPLTATLTQTPGQANLRSVRVVLPSTINARLTVINDACTRAAFEAGHCEKARAGMAVAKTPLLKDPLRGAAYFVRNGNRLPDLFVALRGQVPFDLIGRITIPGSKRLATTFDAIPDVPISSFSLSLVSGRDGSVGTAANLCSARARRAKAELDFVGQNGKVKQVDQALRIQGCGKAARHHRTARGARKSRGGGR